MGGKLWLFLLLGCCLLAGCQQTETVSVPPAVGCYPVEGYAPDPADLAAAPYTYTGGAQGISVTCTVRQAEPAAFSALLQEKAALCAQLAQNKRANPDPSYQQGQESLLAKAQGEQAALQQAGTVYETTLLLKGIGQAEGQVLTLSSGEQVYLSLPLAPGQERLTLYNTPAGEYSEGVLLPHLPSYQVSLETGEGEPPLSFLLEEPAAGGPGPLRRAAALVGYHPWGGGCPVGSGDGVAAAPSYPAGERPAVHRLFDLWSVHDGLIHCQHPLPLCQYVGGRAAGSAEI